MSINKDLAFAHASGDAPGLHGLIQASWKLGYDRSHGKLYAWIDSSTAFLKTTVFSAVHIVNDVFFALAGLLGSFCQSGRRFFI